MLIFLTDGRLGNQIFQYAFLKTLAKNNELIIITIMKQFSDTFEYNNESFKQVNSNVVLRKLIKPYLLPFLVKLKIIGYVKQNRNETSALPSLTAKKGLLPITLVESNFFQSETFFHKESLDFKIKKNFESKAEDIVSTIPEHYAKVFVHVRRGDYLFEQYLNERGIDLPKNYFLNAIEIIKKDVENPYFIFLSDDPAYCECCFKDIEHKYISKNSMEVDLAIMTLCEYGIVSNSSFSWWGAYMMKKRKKVVFPKYWYGWKRKIESHVGIQPEWATIIEVNGNEN